MKKRWFIGYSRTFWVPVSLEGWAVTLAFALALFLVYKVNGFIGDMPFQLSIHWPVIVEMAIVTACFFWVTRGRVDKRY